MTDFCTPVAFELPSPFKKEEVKEYNAEAYKSAWKALEAISNKTKKGVVIEYRPVNGKYINKNSGKWTIKTITLFYMGLLRISCPG